jgi:hypothetical protein
MTSANAKKYPSSAERYEALWEIKNQGGAQLFSHEWKRLVELNIKNGFLIGWPSFPSTASKRMMERVNSRQKQGTQQIDTILDWVVDQVDHVHLPESSILGRAVPATFGNDILMFFKNMQLILKMGKNIALEPAEFWPWLVTALKTLKPDHP